MRGPAKPSIVQTQPSSWQTHKTFIQFGSLGFKNKQKPSFCGLLKAGSSTLVRVPNWQP